MSAAETMVTAEAEEALRVMAHIRDSNREVAEVMLQMREGHGAASASTAKALQRLEELPCLLGDFRFSDEAFWNDRVRGLTADSPNAVASNVDLPMAQHLLSIAWHCGRAGVGPRLLLGIRREVGLLITTLRFRQLDAIALTYAGEVRRRWDDVPQFWEQLLATAQHGSDEQWSRFQVHALRLLGRESL
ncbi:MAG TPA: hypothetical protein PKE27_04595 [Povalibacter sp.]|uniref:hypothetical protein n=1 Tax=Povalibacter sp. TaxID=1962978 RepID=UPI002B67ED3B|nr:hypothetical protein [Povalibacter sp.]HMN43824.1 hypothetical protein [Povalibacter sp.]